MAGYGENDKPVEQTSSGAYGPNDKPASSGFRRAVVDPALSLLKGAVSVPESLVGVADIATGGAAGRAAEALGFRPRQAKEVLSSLQSPELQANRAYVGEADGFIPTIQRAIERPSVIADTIAESIPAMGAGGAVGRGALAVAPRLGAAGAAALGEGAVGAGMAAEGIRQETEDGGLTGRQAALAAGSGAATGGLGFLGARAARALGIGDVDTAIVRGRLGPEGAAAARKSVPRKAAEGFVAEGALEELPQSMSEQAIQNVALGRPVGEGVPEAGAMGLLAGGATGAAIAPIGGRPTPAPTPAPTSAPVQAPAPAAPIQAAVAPAEPVAAPEPVEPSAPAAAPVAAPVAAAPVPTSAPSVSLPPPVVPSVAAPAEPPAVPVPSAAVRMGIDPAGGPLQAAAAVAVDSGATQANAQAVEGTEGTFPSALAAQRALKQSGQPGKVVRADGGWTIQRQQPAAPVQTPVDARERLPAPALDAEAERAKINEAAHAAATSPQNDLPEPTDAQKKAGNYAKGHVNVQGLDVTVENPAGSTRSGMRPDGSQWTTTMQAHYGYVRRTTGADGDQVDVYLGPDAATSQQVFVVDQIDQQTGKFDEHKAMLGFPDQASAVAAYQAHYDPGWKVGPVTAMSIDQFKEWLKNGDTSKPASQHAPAPSPGAAGAAPVAVPEQAVPAAAAPDSVPADAGAQGADAAAGGAAVPAGQQQSGGRGAVAPAPAGMPTAPAGPAAAPEQVAQAPAPAPKPPRKRAEAPAPAAESDPLRLGITPGDAQPLTVRDGILHLGEDPVYDYDSGEPVQLPDGATDAQIREAMKKAGAVSRRQRFFGGAREEAAAPAPTAAPSSAPSPAPPAPKRTSPAQPAPEDSTPRMRRGEGETGLPEETVQRIVQNLTRGWTRKPKIHVIDSMMQAPAVVARTWMQQNLQGATGEVHGFHWKGQVYLVRSALHSEAQVRETLFHEALGHYGLRQVFGDRLNTILDEIAAQRPALIARKLADYGLDPSDVNDRRQAAEELLAEMAQNRPQIGWVRRAVAAIRQWLRQHGIRVGLSDSDIVANYILPARGWVERGRDSAPSSVTSPAFQRVFHGTPHVVDRFRMDRIGTGEGAQAYGYGLYFASRRQVAEFYQGAVSYRDVVRQFREETPDDASIEEINEAINEGRYSPKMLRLLRALRADDWLGFDYPSQAISAAFRELDAYDASPELRAAVQEYGNLYQTEIPDDSELLDWDKPLSKQPQGLVAKVREAVMRAPERALSDFDAESPEDLANMILDPDNEFSYVYGTLSDIFGSDRAASKALAAVGIPGLRYLDGGSRRSGDGSYNYVIWDEAAIGTPERVQDGDGPRFSRAAAMSRFGDAPAEEARAVQAGIEGKSLVDAAAFIASTGSPDQRIVAKAVVAKLRQLRSLGANLELRVVHRGDTVPDELINARGFTEFAFDSKGFDITVWLNGADVMGKVGTEYEVALHELVHASSMGALLYGQHNPDTQIGRAVADLRAVSDAIAAHISRRFEQADAGEIELTEFEQAMRQGDNNAFRSHGEVIAWTLTSRDAQQYLEGIPYKGGTLWSRFVQAVRKALGLSATADTALSEVLRVSEILMEARTPNVRGVQGFWMKRGRRMSQQQAVGSAVSDGRGTTPPVATDEDVAGKQQGGAPAGDSTTSGPDYTRMPLGRAATAIAKRMGGLKVAQGLAYGPEANRSRYYQMPDGRILRVSDHSFPRSIGNGIAHVSVVLDGDGATVSTFDIQTGVAKKSGEATLSLIDSGQQRDAAGEAISGWYGFDGDGVKLSEMLARVLGRVKAGDLADVALDRVMQESAPSAGLGNALAGRELADGRGEADGSTAAGDSTEPAASAGSDVRFSRAPSGRTVKIAGAVDGLPETIEVDGVQRPTRNSNGQPIHPTEEGIRNFWRGFAGSKAVDEQGRPLVVYHGTAGDFDVFNNLADGFDTVRDGDAAMRDGGGGANRRALYFASEPEGGQVEAYASRDGGNIMPVYVSIKNPATVDQFLEAGVARNEGNAVSALEAQGYDGVIYENVRDGKVVIAFRPEQIKSATGNRGTFDPEDADIRFRRAPSSAITGQPLPTAWQRPDDSRMDDFVYALQDKHVDTKKVLQSIRKSIGRIRDELDPYLQEELYHGRAAKQTKDFLDKELRPLLAAMRERGVEIAEFEEYLHNKHAEARNEQVAKVNPAMPDGGSGIMTADARAYLAALPAEKRRAFDELAKQVQAITRGTRELLVNSGLEKQETIDAWQAAYGDDYVPLMREEMDDARTGIGQGFSVRGSSSRRAMGSDKPVADILANLALQRERAITRAEKQRVGQAVYGLALQAPKPDFWLAIDPALEQDPGQLLQTSMQLVSLGLDPADAQSIAAEPRQRYVDPRTGQVAYRINPALRSADNVLAVRIDGEDKFVFFNARDPRAMRMVAALKNLDADQLGAVMGAVAKMTRWFASINTQFNPIFGVTNLTRDLQTAVLNLSSTPLADHKAEVLKHVLPALRGIYADLRAHRAGKMPTSAYAQLFEEFQREGGQTGYRDMFANAAERADAIASELAAIKEGRAMRVGRGIMGWLSDYNEAMENAVRVAAYKVAKEQGLSNQQAASIAKNLTVNFNRKGQVALQAGALYAFFNASVQGTARIAETMFKDGKLSDVGKKILTGGITLGVLQALALAAAGYDDEEPPDFVRERSMVIPIGDDNYVSIPMPLGFHVLPNLGRIPTEWVLSGFRDTPKRVAQLVGLFSEAFNPIGSAGLSLQTITPTVIDPLAALAENRDWTGKPIARKDFDPMRPTAGHTRAKDTATPWARMIAYGVNAATGGTDFKPGAVSPTPDQIDYLIGQITGGVGREASKMSQVLSGTMSGEDVPLYKVPLVGRFVGTTQGQAAEASRFYNTLREIGAHKVELDGLRKAGRFEEAAEYLQENPSARFTMLANRLQRQVSQAQQLKRELLSRDAPREQVQAVDERITMLMRTLNDRVRQLEREAA